MLFRPQHQLLAFSSKSRCEIVSRLVVEGYNYFTPTYIMVECVIMHIFIHQVWTILNFWYGLGWS